MAIINYLKQIKHSKILNTLIWIVGGNLNKVQVSGKAQLITQNNQLHYLTKFVSYWVPTTKSCFGFFGSHIVGTVFCQNLAYLYCNVICTLIKKKILKFKAMLELPLCRENIIFRLLKFKEQLRDPITFFSKYPKTYFQV